MARHLHTCSLCEALCGITVEVEQGVPVSVRGDRDDPFSKGHLCPKAAALLDLTTDPDRVLSPLRRVGERWEPIGWDEALDLVADRLYAVQQAHGRHAVASYLGNPNAHHYGSLLCLPTLQRAIRSRSRFSASSSDQLPQMLAAQRLFGHPLRIPVPDLDRCELLVVLGANPYASNGSLMSTGGARRRFEDIAARGGRVIVLDPRRTETAEAAHAHHFLRPGSDALWLLSVVQVLFEEGLVRAPPWLDGVDAIRQLADGFEPERTEALTGVAASVTRQLARDLATSERSALYARIGVCTQEHGALSAWLVWVVDLLIGAVDREGGMMFTAPAADFVQAAAWAGTSGHFAAWRSRVRGLPEFAGELPVAALAEEIEAPGEGQVRALVCVAGNPVLSTPNGSRLERALGGLDFMVAIDLYLNETTRHAEVFLPVSAGLERDHYGLVFHALAVRNTARYSEAAVPAPPGVREDWQIALELAERLHRRRGEHRQALAARLMRRVGARRLLDLLVRASARGQKLPWGPGLTLARIAAAPHGLDLGPLEPALPGALRTPNQRVQLVHDDYAAEVEALRARLGEARRPGLVLIGRRQLRSNNTWLHNSYRLVKGKPRCTLLMHPDDAAGRQIAHGAMARVRSRVGEVEVQVEVSEQIMPGVVSLPHGWGHGREGVRLRVAAAHPGVSVNDLTDEQFVDRISGNAGFSGVEVEVVGV